MNDNPKAASTQESIASHFDFADATDPAERERLLMEELRRAQSALAEADIEIKQKQRTLAERAFEQEAADARDLLHAACWTADFDDEDNPTGFRFSDERRRILGYETGEGLPGNGGSSDRFIAPPRRPCQNQQRIPHRRNGGRSLRRQLLRAAQGRQAHVGPRRHEVPAR